jgi:hypothetical protein
MPTIIESKSEYVAALNTVSGLAGKGESGPEKKTNSSALGFFSSKSTSSERGSEN